MRRNPHAKAVGVLGLAALGLSPGCAGDSREASPFRGVERAEEYAAQPRGRTIANEPGAPPATVNGEPVEWEDLRFLLAEAAGGAVLEEVALGRLLDAEAARRGVTVGEASIREERQQLLESLAIEGDAAGTEQLLERVRARRGLGPARFASLLRRNAILRALVRDRVEIGPEQVELAWRVQHGERVRIRIIATATEREAQLARREAVAGDPADLELRFADLAEDRSTDPSASRGGLVEPFSPEDPAYEPAIRSVVGRMAVGEVSPVVAIANGFAVAYLDERLPADGVTLASASPALREQLRVRQERLLMDELAGQLLAEARITPFDEALRWSVDAGAQR